MAVVQRCVNKGCNGIVIDGECSDCVSDWQPMSADEIIRSLRSHRRVGNMHIIHEVMDELMEGDSIKNRTILERQQINADMLKSLIDAVKRNPGNYKAIEKESGLKIRTIRRYVGYTTGELTKEGKKMMSKLEKS